jgi:hypothetical protein
MFLISIVVLRPSKKQLSSMTLVPVENVEALHVILIFEGI